MFSCEYCKICSNICFEKHLRMGSSENNKEKFLGKATSHNDHYMINMGGQRPKTSPYLQCRYLPTYLPTYLENFC